VLAGWCDESGSWPCRPLVATASPDDLVRPHDALRLSDCECTIVGYRAHAALGRGPISDANCYVTVIWVLLFIYSFALLDTSEKLVCTPRKVSTH
jgi:hypothetical protein